jgi:hypothetical protein
LSELRAVTATLVAKYHVNLAANEDGCSVERDMRDNFTASPGALSLSFVLRD